MKGSTQSYLKVQYEFRPAKQVERRMLVDALHMLSHAGFRICDYQYTGLGSIAFVDFILFHKLLGIAKMLSVEHDRAIRRRIEFNKPFDFIEVEIGEIGNVIPSLSDDEKHVLWLDYDDIVSEDHLEDIKLAATYLTRGSLLIVTIDIEPPGGEDDGPAEWREYFEDQAGVYLPQDLNDSDFLEHRLTRVNIDIVGRAIKAGIKGRGLRMIPLFNFVYADGHRMLTMGGMIGTDVDRRRIAGSGVKDLFYARLDWRSEPYEIRVPVLTLKERSFLDSKMPCRQGYRPKKFELPPEYVEAYKEIYRFMPIYAELLL